MTRGLLAIVTKGFSHLWRWPWFWTLLLWPWDKASHLRLWGRTPLSLSLSIYIYICIYICAVHAKSLQLCPTLCDPLDYSLPGSSVHGIFQARILEWVAVPSSRGSSQFRERTRIFCGSYIAGRFLTVEPLGKPHIYMCFPPMNLNDFHLCSCLQFVGA